MMLLAQVLSFLTTVAPPDALFTRDQGVLAGLVRWGPDFVALAEPPCRLDLEGARCTPITLPSLERVRLVAGESPRFAVGTAGGETVVVRERPDGTWERLSPPALPARDWLPVAMAADHEDLAVVWAAPTQQRFGVITASPKDGWRVTPLMPSSRGLPTQLLHHRGRWLFGTSRGEWGGDLRVLGPKGTLRSLEAVGTRPVQGLLPAGGKVIVGTGVAHLGSKSALVGTLNDRDEFTVLMQVDHRARVNWPLDAPDSVEGLALDDQGQLVLWLGENGLVRVAEGKLEPLTPGWPRYIYGVGLQLTKDLAIMATYDSGVLLWRLGASEVRRVPIPGGR